MATITSSCSSNRSSTTSASGSDGVSEVWKYFIKKAEIAKALCTVCNRLYSYRGTTSNLRDHLESAHGVIFENRRKRKADASSSSQQSLDNYLRPQQCSNSRSKDICESIVGMIVTDTRPVRIVECEGFRNLMSVLEPGFVMPSRKTISSIIQHKHQQGRKELVDILSKNACSVALTTDIWTSTALDAYITVSAHYITSSWEVVCCVLGTKEFPGSHTGVAISEKIIEIVEEFGIKDKISAIVHDQAANMQLSLNILRTREGYEL